MAPKSLCLITALAPVPAFLGGSCPLGCSLSAPATGGVHRESPCPNICGRLRGGEAGRGPTSWDIIAHLFVFYKGGVTGAADSGVRPLMGTDGFVLACALHQRRVWLGVRRYPTGPPSNVFGNRGTRCTPGGGCAPCTLLGGGQRRRFPTWRVGMLPSQGKGMGPLRSAIQRGHSPVERGHSAVIAPTAVRPRCDGLFPAGAALRRF